ncbi:MAG: hypothetical protein AB8G11_00505 [Saprospiraceae bacterium]
MYTQEDKTKQEKALQLYNEGKYLEALDIFQFLAYKQNDVQMFYEVAKTYLKLDKPELAISNLGNATRSQDDAKNISYKKEFAKLLYTADYNDLAYDTYLPILKKPKFKSDIITGIQYLLNTSKLDYEEKTSKTVELLATHAFKHPNIIDRIVSLNIEEELKVTLKSKEEVIVETIKKQKNARISEVQATIQTLSNEEDNQFDGITMEIKQLINEYQNSTTIIAVVDDYKDIEEAISQIEGNLKQKEDQTKKSLITEIHNQHKSLIHVIKEQLKNLSGDNANYKEIRNKANILLDEIKTTTDTNLLQEKYKALSTFLDGLKKYNTKESKSTENTLALSTTLPILTNKPTTRQSNNLPSTTKKEEVIILPDEREEKKRKGILIVVGVVVLAIICYFAFIKNAIEVDKRILLTNVFLRMYPDAESAKMNEESYKVGTAMEVLEESGEWLKLKAPDKKEGYMKAEYMINKIEYSFIEGIFGNQEAKDILESARHKIALMNLFRSYNWKGDISKELEKDFYEDEETPNRGVYQIYSSDDANEFNTATTSDLTPRKKKEMACIIQGSGNDYLVIYSFSDDNIPILLHQEELNGRGYELKEIIAKDDNGRWYQGSMSYGSRNYEYLYYNSLYIRNNSCKILYVYNDGLRKYLQNDCY